MSPSDAVRSYFLSRYLAPARKKGETKFTVRAGDVHSALKLHNRVPAVCQALRSQKLLAEHGLRIVEKKGPPSGLSTTVTYTYEIVDPTNIEREDVLAKFRALHGIFKGLFPKGGEAYLRNERRELDKALARKSR